MVLAAECDGAEIRTIEGLAHDRQLDPIQTALLEAGAVQCGFLHSGILSLPAHCSTAARNPMQRDSQAWLQSVRCTAMLHH